MKKILLAILVAIVGVSFSGCTDADVVSKNLSKDADMFRINRRIVFYNGITNQYILEIDGFCSIEDSKNIQDAVMELLAHNLEQFGK